MFGFIIILTTLLFGLKGFLSGLIIEIANFFGIIGGIFIATRVSKWIAEALGDTFVSITNPATIELLIFFVLLGTSIFLSKISVKYFQVQGEDTETITTQNRIAGYFVGIVKYFSIFAIILAILSGNPSIKQRIKSFGGDSITYRLMLSYGNFIINKNIEFQ